MKKISIFLLLVICLTGIVEAQIPPPERKRRKEVQERIKSVKIWKMSETLNLSEDQSARFFPRYNKVEEEIRGINEQMEELIDDLADAAKPGREDFKVQNAMDKYQKLSMERLQKKLEFIAGTSDILTDKQQAALIVFEQRFPERVRRIVEDMRSNYPKPPREGIPDPPDGR